jgi:hypothetical protein
MCLETERRDGNDNPNRASTRNYSRVWPERSDGFSFVSFLQSSTFSYMSKILNEGAERARSGEQLTHDHLYEVPDRMKSSALTEAFYREFEAKKGKSRHLLFMALWKVAAPDFIPAGFCELIALVCQITLPLVVRSLLEVLEQNPQEKVIKQGLLFSLAIFGCTLFRQVRARGRGRCPAVLSQLDYSRLTQTDYFQVHLSMLSPAIDIGTLQ